MHRFRGMFPLFCDLDAVVFLTNLYPSWQPYPLSKCNKLILLYLFPPPQNNPQNHTTSKSTLLPVNVDINVFEGISLRLHTNKRRIPITQWIAVLFSCSLTSPYCNQLFSVQSKPLHCSVSEVFRINDFVLIDDLWAHWETLVSFGRNRLGSLSLPPSLVRKTTPSHWNDLIVALLALLSKRWMHLFSPPLFSSGWKLPICSE